MLDFADSVRSVVYVEGLVGWIYLDSLHDLKRYQLVFERLSTIALTPQESVEHIIKVGAQHKSASALNEVDADALVDRPACPYMKASVKDS